MATTTARQLRRSLPTIVTCGRCQQPFNVQEDVGQWDCRVHPCAGRVTDATGAHYYPCCGLSLAEEAAAAIDAYRARPRDDIRGCTSADHIDAGERRARDPADIAVLPVYKQATPLSTDARRHVLPAPSARPAAVRPSDLLASEPEDTGGAGGGTVGVLSAPSVVAGQQLTWNIRDELDRMLEAAYANPAFHLRHPQAIQQALQLRAGGRRALDAATALSARLLPPGHADLDTYLFGVDLEADEFVGRYLRVADTPVDYVVVRQVAPHRSRAFRPTTRAALAETRPPPTE